MRVSIPNPRLLMVGLGALAATLGLWPAAADELAVQVYECKQGGQVTFSGTPCTDPGGDPVVNSAAEQQQVIDVDYSRPSAVQAAAALRSAAAAENQAGRVAEAALLDTEILNLEQRISNLTTERDERVSALQNQLNSGSTESINTAAWAAGLNQQIQSVEDSYNDTLLADRARLGELQAQRQALGSSGPSQ